MVGNLIGTAPSELEGTQICMAGYCRLPAKLDSRNCCREGELRYAGPPISATWPETNNHSM
jgi:hypothetical protein